MRSLAINGFGLWVNMILKAKFLKVLANFSISAPCTNNTGSEYELNYRGGHDI